MTHDDNPPILLADVDAERKLLAVVLADNGAFERLGVRSLDFHDPAHRDLWAAAAKILERGEAVSVAVLGAALPRRQANVARLPDVVAFAGSASQYAGTVRDFANRRHLLAMAIDLQDKAGDTALAPEDVVADAMERLSGIRLGREAERKGSIATAIFNDLEHELPIFSTGFEQLDRALGGGLITGKLVGIGARKKTGKTILAGTISHNLNASGVRHLFIALEMSSKEIEQRNIGRQMGFNAIHFLRADRADLRNKVGEYITTTPDETLYEHLPGGTLYDIRGAIARARMRGIKGVIVDGLQLIRGRSKSETEASHLDRVSQWLADETRRTGLWILVTCQLNQDTGNIRGGEGLKMACDQYFVLHREKEYGAWLEMQESRHTLYRNVGSETQPGVWMRKAGPHFSSEPPGANEWPSASGGFDAGTGIPPTRGNA